MEETWVQPLGQADLLEKEMATHSSILGAFLVAQAVKNLQYRRHRFNPWVRKIPWRRKWQPSILAWKIPWTEEAGGPQPWGHRKLDMTEHTW